MSKLTLGSLFDGSGGFPLGAFLNDITPIWASEVEPFPIRVTTKRMPQVKHLGDISAIDGGKIEPVDIITFGSPCTNLSVAGKREGLGGDQSSLFFEAIRIIREMRCATDGKYPRWICWENVPGAYSSNKGQDFRQVLTEIAKIKDETTSIPMPENGKWTNAGEILGDDFSCAWRTLDAQFWGVAQRRRRCYLVADFAGECAGKVLFEFESMSGYTPQSFGSWQGTAGGAANCTGESSKICLNDQGGSRMDVTNDVTCTLRAEAHHPPCIMEASGFCTEHSAQSRGIGFEKEKSPTLRAGIVPGVAIENHPADGRIKISEDGIVQTLSSRMGTGGNNVPLTLKIRSGCEGGGKGALIQEDKSATLSTVNDQSVFVPKAYGICSKDSNAMKSDNPHSGIYEAETSRTLDAGGGNPSCNQGGIAVCVQGSMIGREEKNGPQGNGVNEETAFTLNTVDRHAVAYAMTTGGYSEIHEEQAATLMARDYKDPQVVNQPEYLVRRLTPTECALLQGFPPDWCADLETAEPTDADISFWTEVFSTYARISGKKPKTEKQIIKWLGNPHTDSAEYKMWGNSVALPCVCFVMAGIAYYTQSEIKKSP